MEQAVARGRPRGLALVVTWLSEAYLLAGRMEEACQRAMAMTVWLLQAEAVLVQLGEAERPAGGVS